MICIYICVAVIGFGLFESQSTFERNISKAALFPHEIFVQHWIKNIGIQYIIRCMLNILAALFIYSCLHVTAFILVHFVCNVENSLFNNFTSCQQNAAEFCKMTSLHKICCLQNSFLHIVLNPQLYYCLNVVHLRTIVPKL